MPLILLSGYPSSGLTHRATQLITHFTQNPPSSSPSFKIVHISDDTLSIPRSSYDNARDEKNARAALSSAIKRNLGRETLVIADAMNYIKGFRYQMWCEAKAAGTGCCVVHVAANPEQATTLHNRRLAQQSTEASSQVSGETSTEPPAYNPSTFQNLISRYEEPSPSARWDSPLFTLPYSDLDPPYDAIATALFSTPGRKAAASTQSLLQPELATSSPEVSSAQAVQGRNGTASSTPGSIAGSGPGSGPGGLSKGRAIKPHLATVAPKAMSSDALYTLEKTTSEIVKVILVYISTNLVGSECSGEVIGIPRTAAATTVTTKATDMPMAEAKDEDRRDSMDVDEDEDDRETDQGELQLTLPRSGNLSIAHLQRLKRQFVTLYRSRGVGMGAATSGGSGALGGGDLGEEAVRRSFVGFLNGSFESGEV